jgi:hypothetical protein
MQHKRKNLHNKSTEANVNANVDAGQNKLNKHGTSDVYTHKAYIHDDLSDVVHMNPFSALGDGVILGPAEDSSHTDQGVHLVESDSEDEVDEHMEFDKPSTVTNIHKEASTSSANVSHV